MVNALQAGPWMTEFYANKANLSNLETGAVLERVMKNVKQLASRPLSLLLCETTCFDTKLDRSLDPVLASLQQTCIDNDLLLKTLQVVFSSL